MCYEFLGIKLQSPFIIGSGPLSYGAEGMIKLHEAGAGAVVTKTIGIHAAENPVNHMIKYNNNTLINCEKWSDYDGNRWINEELPKAVEAGVVCIASVGQTLEDVKAIVEGVEKAGAAIIELVSYTAEELVPMIEYAKSKVSIPVLVKLSPNVKNFLELARECKKAGADGFTACDSVGPTMKIDIETGRPVLGGADGKGWLSGAMIKPITIQKVCELRREFDIPIIGLGGVTSYEDAVEMCMAGADLIGICSVVILQGLGVISKLNDGVNKYLKEHNKGSLSDIVGLAQKYLPKEEIKAGYSMGFDKEKCTKCQRCIRVCTYDARSFDEDDNMILDEEKCRKCGLCVSICNVLK